MKDNCYGVALFLVARFEWKKILEIAQCKILSSCSNNFLDAYLLRYELCIVLISLKSKQTNKQNFTMCWQELLRYRLLVHTMAPFG